MSAQNFSFLACQEVAEKFVVGWRWWSRPVLGLSQAEHRELLAETAPVKKALFTRAVLVKQELLTTEMIESITTSFLNFLQDYI